MVVLMIFSNKGKMICPEVNEDERMINYSDIQVILILFCTIILYTSDMFR